MDATRMMLAILCGGPVGFTLGLIGGGGSIIATPLLLYVVGLPPHVAIGTSACSVSANALFNFAGHARSGNVRWRSASIFAIVGAVGASLDSSLGKQVDGQRLLFLFAFLMVAVGIAMLLSKPGSAASAAPEILTAVKVHKVSAVALAVGVLAGFFGIGGGFLIVPGLLAVTGMSMISAVGSSLLAVSVLSTTTATSYAMSGLVDWPVATLYIGGGLVGGVSGMRVAATLAPHRMLFSRVFSCVIFSVAAYIMCRTILNPGLR